MKINEVEGNSEFEGFTVLDARCPVCHYKVKVMYPVMLNYAGGIMATGLCKRHSLVDISENIEWCYL